MAAGASREATLLVVPRISRGRLSGQPSAERRAAHGPGTAVGAATALATPPADTVRDKLSARREPRSPPPGNASPHQIFQPLSDAPTEPQSPKHINTFA